MQVISASSGYPDQWHHRRRARTFFRVDNGAERNHADTLDSVHQLRGERDRGEYGVG